MLVLKSLFEKLSMNWCTQSNLKISVCILLLLAVELGTLSFMMMKTGVLLGKLVLEDMSRFLMRNLLRMCIIATNLPPIGAAARPQ